MDKRTKDYAVGMVADGEIRPPTMTRQQERTIRILIDDSVPDDIWVMNAGSLQFAQMLLRFINDHVPAR